MNEKMMKRTVYEAPVTELFRIELEGNFCGSAEIENPNNNQTGKIDQHGVDETLGDFADDNFSTAGWN